MDADDDIDLPDLLGPAPAPPVVHQPGPEEDEDPELPHLADSTRDWIIHKGWMDKEAAYALYDGFSVTDKMGSLIPLLEGTRHFSKEQLQELDEVERLADTVPGFKLLKRLGEGAVGAVYLALHKEKNIQVALKFLHGDIDGLDEHRQRFEREAETLRSIDHEIIPKLIAHSGVRAMGDLWGSGEVHEVPAFIAMEYADGVTMRDLIDRFGNLPEKFALRCIADCARALHHVYERTGVIHRDIKPGNIVIENVEESDDHEDWTLKIIDFGLAKAGCVTDGCYSEYLLDSAKNAGEEGSSSITSQLNAMAQGTILGTPQYMAPEQIKSEVELDWRVDCYALGATLYCMLTGNPPFNGGSATEVLVKHLMDERPDPQQVNPRLNQRSAWVCMKAMAIDRDERYGSYLEFAEALDRARYAIENEVQREVTRHNQALAEEASAKVSTLPSRPPAAPSSSSSRRSAASPSGSRPVGVDSKPLHLGVPVGKDGRLAGVMSNAPEKKKEGGVRRDSAVHTMQTFERARQQAEAAIAAQKSVWKIGKQPFIILAISVAICISLLLIRFLG